MTYRDNVSFDQTPIQQSMTVDEADYAGVYQVGKLMLGVILEVHPSDREQGNSSSWQSKDRRGYRHEATVLIVDDGTEVLMPLEHVVIPPDAPSGLDDYTERLPRGSTGVTSGAQMTPMLTGIDPYELDGDWCVVGFIGGHIDRPFILRWWPHARNTTDPATSGAGNPDRNGVGKAFTQDRRFFKRVNGVETVITSKGDVVISTTFAGGKVQMAQPAVRGRFARTQVTEGGNVRVYMKPSASMEWVWDAQEDGFGALDSVDRELPQTNPAPNKSPTDKVHSYVRVNSDEFVVQVPSKFVVRSEDTVELTAAALVHLTAPDLVFAADSSATLSGQSVALGASSATEPLVKGASLAAALSQIASVLALVPPAVLPPPAPPPTDPLTAAVAEACRVAILGIAAAVNANLSTVTKTV